MKVHPRNILFESVTLDISKMSGSGFGRDRHSANIYASAVAFDVSMPVISRSDRL